MAARTRVIAGAALALAVAAPLVVASPAAAAEQQLLVSSDGIHFTPGLDGGLFDDTEKLVPGQAITASLWLRNATEVPAELRVSVNDMAMSSPQLASSLNITAVDTGRGTTVSSDVDELRQCDIIVPSRRVGAGRTVRIELTLRMLDVDRQIAQNELGSWSMRAAMRDGAAGPFPASACEDDGVDVPIDPGFAGGADAERLGTTGTDAPTGWAVLAGALVAFGVLLIARRRRREPEDETP